MVNAFAELLVRRATTAPTTTAAASNHRAITTPAITRRRPRLCRRCRDRQHRLRRAPIRPTDWRASPIGGQRRSTSGAGNGDAQHLPVYDPARRTPSVAQTSRDEMARHRSQRRLSAHQRVAADLLRHDRRRRGADRKHGSRDHSAPVVPANGGCKLNQTRRVVLARGDATGTRSCSTGSSRRRVTEPASTSVAGLDRRFLELPAASTPAGRSRSDFHRSGRPRGLARRRLDRMLYEQAVDRPRATACCRAPRWRRHTSQVPRPCSSRRNPRRPSPKFATPCWPASTRFLR